MAAQHQQLHLLPRMKAAWWLLLLASLLAAVEVRGQGYTTIGEPACAPRACQSQSCQRANFK